jgi:hypothetical protein
MKLALITVLATTLLPRYALANFTSNPVLGWTQPSSQVIAQLPPEPDTGTSDGQRTPGGTRREQMGACKQTEKPLTALIPVNGKGLTTAEDSVFWFYIPYTPEEIDSIEFSLHNEDETTTLYRTSIQLTKTPGVIGIPLPVTPEHSLKLNESYHWYFILNCKRKERFEDDIEDDIIVQGWVTRVQRSPNLWYDELTNLAKRYLSEPQNPEVKKAWTQLLQSVGLEGLAQEPLIQPVSNLKK